MKGRPFVIGLTGNIATGKSTVGAMLAELGAAVIDGDIVAHEVMRRGSPVYDSVVARYDASIIGADGEIDRRALGARVFADPCALSDLDRLVHPAVRARVREMLSESDARVVVVEAVKLIEAGMDADCDSLWVVTAPRDVQISRLMQRSGLDCEEAARRVDAQPDQAARAARADVVIDNGGCRAETLLQVRQAWRGLFPTSADADSMSR